MIPETREDWRRYFFAHAPAVPRSFEKIQFYELFGERTTKPPTNSHSGVLLVIETDLEREMRWRTAFSDAAIAKLNIQ